MQPDPESMNTAAYVLPLSELDTKRLKELYRHGRTLNVLAGLWLLGAALYVLMAFTPLDDSVFDPVLFNGFLLIIAAMQLIVAIGVIRRRAWARIPGTILCVLILPGIPIGTLIGILGLIAFSGSKSLFGDEGYRAAAVAHEYRQRTQRR